MNGINGLITIAKYWREWSNPRRIVLHNKNNAAEAFAEHPKIQLWRQAFHCGE